jgi:3-oxosteroid 1-dehydrogenase
VIDEVIMESNATSFDETVDVLVVGTGAGAMTAALRAHDNGAKALLIEKSDRYGGSSAMSSCLLWIPNNHLMADVGVPDTPEEAWDYLKGTTAGTVSEDRLRAYLETGPKLLRYLADETHASFVSLPEYADYYPRVAGSKPGGRSVEPEHFDARQLGEDFINLRSQNPQMQVMGRLGMTAVEARMTMTGQPGGMTLFLKLWLKYLFDIRWRFRSPRDRNPSGGNALIGMLRLSLLDRKIPLWLNTGARELIVEDGRVVGVVAEREGKTIRIGATRGVILGAGGFEGNQVMREKYLPKPTRKEWSCANPHNTGEVIEMAMKLGAGIDLMDDAWWGPTTVVPGEDLARFLVIEKSLPRSILVNKRGETIYDRYYGDAKVEPNPCLGPIDTAPYYAIEAFPGELGTKGGLTVDARARVLTEAGEAIPGLYAIGNCSASVMGRSYPGAGATIGPATTFGFIAANDATGG